MGTASLVDSIPALVTDDCVSLSDAVPEHTYVRPVRPSAHIIREISKRNPRDTSQAAEQQQRQAKPYPGGHLKRQRRYY